MVMSGNDATRHISSSLFDEILNVHILRCTKYFQKLTSFFCPCSENSLPEVIKKNIVNMPKELLYNLKHSST